MKISYSIVAYNRPKLLERALDSLAMQDSRNWTVSIANDNSSDPLVEELAVQFLKAYGGVYWNSRVKDEERLETCRPSVCMNALLPHMEGEIWAHLSDDAELARPTVVSEILEYFETHPEVKAGYVGVGYRLVDYKTGYVFPPEQITELIRKAGFSMELAMARGFTEKSVIIRQYPETINYGGVLDKTFAILECVQMCYRKELGVLFPIEKKFWMGEDAFVSQRICDEAGGFYPIGNPRGDIMVVSNLNEASLTIQGSPEKAVAVTK